ncbi:MAG: alanine--tRNA ligase [Acidobacteria bacterium]|nr:alanine--tRNA ligase [Acidobacteriota bacterium]MCA1620735.1 alanine--tRNA ligase [Acidobacteriota bacterium]
MTGNEIRERFLSYFEKHGHRRVASSPLLPANDPTLLFANAGMNQFKDVFLGSEKRDYARAASSQKCLRAGGKHNDLDEVGKTARHHTFFEMLGNFSFGDYFKEDAIRFACGPNSEINYYLGEHPEDPEFNRPEHVNGPGDTTMEIWNLVFMQYNRVETAPGKYALEPLPAPSVDTGLGLERFTAVIQGVKTNYDTDIIRPAVEFTARLADRHYEPDTPEGFAMRVIADHARATAFSVADGILPSNEGRNYVLRKIMRRAIYHGRNALGFEGNFFHKVADFVVDQMKDAYPELETSREFIGRMVRLEEERFGSTLTVGLQKLEALFSTATEGEMPDYAELARLYDTFGTPRDLIRVGLEERGFGVDEDTYNEEFDRALREIQGASAKGHAAAAAKANPVYAQIAERAGAAQFTGYDETRTDGAKVLALLRGEEEVEELSGGDEGEVALDRTPFYAEAGGQVGDTGVIVRGDTHATVNDTPPSPASGLVVHRVKVDRGNLRVGDTVTAQVDVEKRDATRRNHTATHLMHAALREVLGTHVKQAGSVVAPNYLRFDFSHFQPLTRDELAEIERLVNYQILRNERVQTDLVSLDEAMRSGAMALFGEKYAEKVRVLTVPGFSKELCGGTHVRATGDIGLFKIKLKKARREADELRLKLALGGGASSSQDGRDVREVEGGVTVLAREASDLDASALRQLSDTLLAQIKTGVVVLGRRADGKASLIVRTSPDLSKRVPAGRVIKELAPIIGGRGGGKPDMAEGGGPEPQKLSEALEASYQIVERLLTEQAASA